MKQLFKKKGLMTVALVGALGLAVYLNYYLVSEPTLNTGTQPEDSSIAQSEDHLGDATFVGVNVSNPDDKDAQGSEKRDATDKQETGDKQASAEGDYFEKARQNRITAREEALGIIQEVLDNAQASAQDKKQATQKATAIAENVLQESHIENLILAKGFADSVVFIDGDSCSVVVRAEALQQQESLQIMEIVVSQSSVAADKVQIMAAKS